MFLHSVQYKMMQEQRIMCTFYENIAHMYTRFSVEQVQDVILKVLICKCWIKNESNEISTQTKASLIANFHMSRKISMSFL